MKNKLNKTFIELVTGNPKLKHFEHQVPKHMQNLPMVDIMVLAENAGLTLSQDLIDAVYPPKAEPQYMDVSTLDSPIKKQVMISKPLDIGDYSKIELHALKHMTSTPYAGPSAFDLMLAQEKKKKGDLMWKELAQTGKATAALDALVAGLPKIDGPALTAASSTASTGLPVSLKDITAALKTMKAMNLPQIKPYPMATASTFGDLLDGSKVTLHSGSPPTGVDLATGDDQTVLASWTITGDGKKIMNAHVQEKAAGMLKQYADIDQDDLVMLSIQVPDTFVESQIDIVVSVLREISAFPMGEDEAHLVLASASSVPCLISKIWAKEPVLGAMASMGVEFVYKRLAPLSDKDTI